MADKKNSAIDDEKDVTASEPVAEETEATTAGIGTHDDNRGDTVPGDESDSDIEVISDDTEEAPYQAKHMASRDGNGAADDAVNEPDADATDDDASDPAAADAVSANDDAADQAPDEDETSATGTAADGHDSAEPVSDSDVKKRNKKLKRDMRVQSIKRHKRLIILAVIAVIAFAIGYFIMSGGYQSFVDSLPAGDDTSTEEANPSDGVAATIDGSYEITEEQVNGYIAQYRTYNGLTSDEDWSEYLEGIGKTAEDVRSDSIDYYATRYAVEKECEKDGISVSNDEVTKELERVKAEYGITDDDTYQDFLDSMGYTDETYRSDIKYNLLQDKLVAENVTPSEPTDAQLESVAERTPTKFTGRKSYNIVFIADTNDNTSMESARASAQRCIDELNGMGDVTVDEFAAVGDEFVADGAAQQSSAVTWDGTVSLVSQYTDALDELDAGEYTKEPVQSPYGYHVIMCTDVFEADDDGTISVNQMPDDLYEILVSDTVDVLDEQNRESYLLSVTNAHDIQINDIPDGLPYDVSSDDEEETGSANENSGSNSGKNANEDSATDGKSNDSENGTDGDGSGEQQDGEQ